MSVDLRGKICPYPVVEFVQAVDAMNMGENTVFFVDDPLAIKSIPEEMEDYENVSLDIVKKKGYWEITVQK